MVRSFLGRFWPRLVLGGGMLLGVALGSGAAGMAQEGGACPVPVLSRLQSHRVQRGETWGAIAARYGLQEVTLLAMNGTQGTRAPRVGQTLRIPPFDGVEVVLAAGRSWGEIADQVGVRADVLFELNGCQAQPPRRVFIPGLSWLIGPAPSTANSPLTRSPLGERGTLVAPFGWQAPPEGDRLTFSGGVTLAATPGPVVAAGAGTVAFVGPQGELGTVVVINHAQGLQTRYGRLAGVQVRVGQRVTAGQAIAEIEPMVERGAAMDSDQPLAMAYLHFEVRLNSSLGWVARDPGLYLPTLAIP